MEMWFHGGTPRRGVLDEVTSTLCECCMLSMLRMSMNSFTRSEAATIAWFSRAWPGSLGAQLRWVQERHHRRR